MNNEFTNYMTNNGFLTGYGWNSKGVVYIENERDCRFWESIFNITHPGAYEFKASFRHDCSRGKDALKELIPGLNKQCLLALDGDFDYICEEYREISRYFKSGYLIHTFSYSRESVIFSKSQLIRLNDSIRLAESNNLDIISIIEYISKTQYKSLVGYLYLINKKPSLAQNIDLHKALKSCQFRNIFNYDFSCNEKELASLKRSTESLEEEIYAKIDAAGHDFSEFVEESRKKGLNEVTAYRYISGHILHDNVILPLYTRIKFLMQRKDILKINALEGDDEQKNQMRQGVINYYKQSCQLKTLINNLSICANDEVYSMILDKVNQIH